MKQKNTVVTLALVSVLALAAVAGGLLPAGNTVHAADPLFDDSSGRTVPENTPPGVNIGTPISATDADETGENALEFGNTLTYKLGGTDAALFDIDASTGQLITKTPLDAEGDGTYSVTVTVDDGETRAADSRCTACTRNVTITVTDVVGTETPLAPVPPTVVSSDDPGTTDTDESTTRLKVVWHPPDNAGRPVITSYAVVYKKSTETGFSDPAATNVDQSGTTTNATITGLEADTSYDVRVQATNSDGAGLWSVVGTGSTNKEGNSAPSFNEPDSLVELDVDENTPAGENIDSPVTATDQDTTTLTYDLGGPHADLFNFNTRSGQIRTKAPLNHEDARCGYVDGATPSTSCIYRVTVTVVDGAGGSDATGVNIEVDDRSEAPLAPARPTVRATENSSASLDVSWNAPANTGPPISDYDVEYRKGTDSFSASGVTVTGTTATTATISGVDTNNNDEPWLSSNTTYEVRVRAKNGERDSAWSGTGNGRTNRANHEPIFDDRPGTGDGSERSNDGSNHTIWRTIDENPRSAQSVGRVFADDADNDRLTYKLIAAESPNEADVDKFTINETTGEIRTKAGETYSYEDLNTGTCGDLTVQQVGSDSCYTVKVEVRDSLDSDRVEDKDEDADDTITVKIGLRDRDEPPSVPTVTVTSPTRDTTNDITKLEVFWHARNSGPPITKYDVQYRKGGGTFSDDNCQDTTADDNCTDLDDDATDDNATTITTTTITGLDEDTSYSVQVRAKNAEGTSGWSTVATLKTNEGANIPPTFTDGGSTTRDVDENTPAGRDVDSAVSASDGDSDRWTYSLGGRDASLFTIVSASGQIRTRSALNHEDPACGYPGTGQDTTCTYTVRVKADDGAGGSASIVVTITVNDEDEPPSAPSAPRVTATKDTGQSLDVSWSAPRNTGKPPITDYDVQYRKVKSGSPDPWQDWPHSTVDAGNTETKTEITRRAPADDAEPLEPRTQYEVRVRAKNGEGDTTENWSSVAKATTGQSNSRPSFDRSESQIVLRVDENTRAGQNLGSAISASDADSNSLTYTLEGPGKDSFTIVSSSGQIRTRSPLDHETRDSYSVTVKVDDRQRKDNSVAAKSVTIMVDDVREAPSPPAAPTVAGIPGSTSSIRVTWAEPANTGPAITGYDVHYREVGSGPLRWEHFGADRSTIITDLKAGTRYEVQVRARGDEDTGAWSRWGSGSPNPDVANRNPTFSGGSRSLSVAENTPPNTDVGAPIAATDRDGDSLTYTLEGADADAFDVLSTSDGGQIRTSAELNHEEKASYAVTVRVRDGRGGTDAANLTIRVTDVDGEAPDTPFAPTVTAVSSTRLQVTWEEPGNTGPPITDYDYRHREPAGSWTEMTNTTITGTAVTIEGLAASTSYDVEVRAKNAEGTSDWSNPGIGATNAPGANNPPVFPDGASATRSVSATAPAGTSIGLPVEATDADSDDTLAYTLEGRDAALFDITTTNGQLLTKSGVTLIARETYTVIVAVDDQTDVARITVSIEATAAPPNRAPVFSEGASATRSVREDAAPGTSIGSPVRATDADQGDTVTHSLEGTDAASFSIAASNGQIRTLAALDASTKSTYSVTVRAADTRGGSATIAVTITVTARPTTFGCATRGAVSDASNVGLVADCEALLGARNNLDRLENGERILNWSARRSITDWDGVYLGGTPVRVTRLILRRMDLNGTVPADLGGLPMLTELNLHTNRLTGSIPADLNGLRRLEKLLLHNNQLSGDIPDLSGLRSLEMLWLSGKDMSLTGGVPTWLNTMSGLEDLTVWGNDLGGRIPNLSGMSSLKRLDIRANGLIGSVPSWLGDMDSLGILYLASNDLSGGIPEELGQLTGLVRMWLDRNDLTGSIPAELGNMTNLRTLNLRDNQLTGSIPPELGRLSNLVHLRLHNNILTGSIPPELGRLSKVTQFYLSGHNMALTGGIPPELRDLDSVMHLSLWGNNLTGPIPPELGDLGDTLTRLRLGGNTGLTGCVPRSLSGATDATDLSEAGLAICP